MTKKARSLFFLVFVLLLAVGVTLVYVARNLDGIVADLIETHGSQATGTDVDVDGVSIELAAARGEIRGLRIANPAGYDGDRAIEFGNLSLALDASTLREDPVVIEEITAGDVRINVEQQRQNNNLRELLAAVTRGESAADDDAAPRKIVIRRFTLSGAEASVSIPELGEDRRVAVPEIVLRDIGAKDGGATATEAARQILEPLLRRIIASAAGEAAQQELIDRIEEAGGDISRELLDKVSGGVPNENQ